MGLVAAARLQTSPSTYIDLLGLTMLTQLASVFTDLAWFLLLLVKSGVCLWIVSERVACPRLTRH